MIIAIIQARKNSKRFPNKSYKKILGHTLCDLVLMAAQGACSVDGCIVADPVMFPYIHEDNVL